MKIYNKILTSICLLSALAIASCTKYDNPPPVFEELKDMTKAQRKVLLISIDGLSGPMLEKIAPPQISALKKNSKYAYNTIRTETPAAGWASILTGTALAKHQIVNNDFERDQNDDNHEHGDVTSYRNVLDYVTQYKTVKTAMVSPWDELRNYVKVADYAPIVNTDQAVKDSTIALIKNNKSLGTIYVNLRDVVKAGDQGGYSEENSSFKAAVLKSDEYVGEIINAMKARESYASEEWLVILTTNMGKQNTDIDDGFIMLYNPLFKEFKLEKSGFNPVQFDNKTGRATLHDPDNRYDAGETKSFTVQMDVKFNNPVPNGYSSFFSKSTNLGGQNITGWQWNFYPSNGQWAVTVGGSNNGGSGKQQINSPNNPGTGVWRNLIMTVEYVNASTRNLSLYMDGVHQATANISSRKSLSSLEDLRVGHRPGDNDVPTNFSAANLTYYNTALSATTIKDNFGLKDISKHPNFANIIGYWPMDEGTGSQFFTGIPGAPNLSLSGKYSWINLGENYPSGTVNLPVTSNISIPTTVNDIAPLTLYWMRIDVLSDFGMDGNSYLNNFELEFLND
ncbi:hypothetical protein GCM10022216_18610 [Sphingobacterium kyonggiense]|uniref:Type I phosphodiesterase/nucleotide pyrophosphatase n=1 Tax=Sphingobacterium kyonggiense TaxID=714075 RepID=A0ABP7YRQ9_9SPHI